jgi:hypothetical protein
MSNMRMTLAAAVTAALLLVGSISPALANPSSTTVAGDFRVTSTRVTSVQPIDGACRIGLTATFSFTGSLVGSFIAAFDIVKLGVCDPSVGATELFVARGTFTGAVAGSSGAFDFIFVGSIDPLGNAHGDLIVTRGSGGLSNLHGTLQLAGQAGVRGTYSGTVFD